MPIPYATSRQPLLSSASAVQQSTEKTSRTLICQNQSSLRRKLSVAYVYRTVRSTASTQAKVGAKWKDFDKLLVNIRPIFAPAVIVVNRVNCYNGNMFSPLLEFDKQQAIARETNFLVGIDEAGRGPLAGPVVACACFIPPSIVQQFNDINDSKKLTETKREDLFERLTSHDGVIYGVGFATAAEIDKINILQATFLAMRRAAQKFLNMPDCCALVDGPYPVQGLTMNQKPIIDGDAKSLAIAAASVIAKVTRDHYMTVLNQLYPGYGFAGHKGYGTAKHLQALRELGPCPEHRRTFGPVHKLLGDTLLP